jgi:hypothetical protein
LHHMPVYNLFRAPARHFVEVALSLSVLSGLGVAALQRRANSMPLAGKAIVGLAGVLITGLIAVMWFHEWLGAMANKTGLTVPGFLPWSNPAIGVPVGMFVMGAAALFYWSWAPASYHRRLFLIGALVIDLASFGMFGDWRYASAGRELLTPLPEARRAKEILEPAHQRLLPLKGVLAGIVEVIPNLSLLWGVPSASGYGPLMLKRLNALLELERWGAITNFSGRAWDRSFDLLAIRYVLIAKHDLQPEVGAEHHGFSWTEAALGLTLGSGCGKPQPDVYRVNLPTPSPASAIGMVSIMGCSRSIPDGVPVLDIVIEDVAGEIQRQRIVAGRNTTGRAADCDHAGPDMQHAGATVFEAFPVRGTPQGECQGHYYRAAMHLDKLTHIKTLEFRWLSQAGAMTVDMLSLLDYQSRQSVPLSPISVFLGDTMHWREIDRFGDVIVYENLRAMPRAWLVPEVVSLSQEDTFHAVKSSQLPDGRVFDPAEMALVEEPVTLTAPHDEQASATILERSPHGMALKTSSKTPALLVLSDIYYPGWEAAIDGKAAQILRTNYLLRGVMLPAGEHRVTFAFRPKSVYLGAGISGLAFGGLLIALAASGRGRWQTSPSGMNPFRDH